jgi:hypothetical protein
MIESSERMIGEQNNLIVDQHFELQFKKLQDVPINEIKQSGTYQLL